MEHEARRSSCYNCGSLEHLARFCPQGPPADGPRPGRAGGGRSRAGGPGGGGDLSLAQRILRTASGPGALDAGVLRLREVVMRNEGRPDQLAEASHALVAEADAGRVAIAVDVLLECAVELPLKAPVFAVLIGLLGAQRPAAGAAVASAAASSLRRCLRLGAPEAGRARALARLCACLPAARAASAASALALLRALVDAALAAANEDAAAAAAAAAAAGGGGDVGVDAPAASFAAGSGGWQPRADALVYAALSAVPWLGEAAAEEEEEARDGAAAAAGADGGSCAAAPAAPAAAGGLAGLLAAAEAYLCRPNRRKAWAGPLPSPARAGGGVGLVYPPPLAAPPGTEAADAQADDYVEELFGALGASAVGGRAAAPLRLARLRAVAQQPEVRAALPPPPAPPGAHRAAAAQPPLAAELPAFAVPPLAPGLGADCYAAALLDFPPRPRLRVFDPSRTTGDACGGGGGGSGGDEGGAAAGGDEAPVERYVAESMIADTLAAWAPGARKLVASSSAAGGGGDHPAPAAGATAAGSAHYPHPAAEQLATGLPLEGPVYEHLLSECLFAHALACPPPPRAGGGGALLPRPVLLSGVATDLCNPACGLWKPEPRERVSDAAPPQGDGLYLRVLAAQPGVCGAAVGAVGLARLGAPGAAGPAGAPPRPVLFHPDGSPTPLPAPLRGFEAEVLVPSFPPAMAGVYGAAFRAAPQGRLHPAAADALAACLAQHLASTGLYWPWARWEACAARPRHCPQRRFVQNVLARLAALTYHARVAASLPPALLPLLGPPPAAAEDPAAGGGWPFADPGCPPAPGAHAARALLQLLVAKADDEAELWPALRGKFVAGDPAAVAAAGGPREGLRLLALALLHRGRKSATHLDTMLARHGGSVARCAAACGAAAPGSSSPAAAEPEYGPLLDAVASYHAPGGPCCHMLAVALQRLLLRGGAPHYAAVVAAAAAGGPNAGVDAALHAPLPGGVPLPPFLRWALGDPPAAAAAAGGGAAAGGAEAGAAARGLWPGTAIWRALDGALDRAVAALYAPAAARAAACRAAADAGARVEGAAAAATAAADAADAAAAAAAAGGGAFDAPDVGDDAAAADYARAAAVEAEARAAVALSEAEEAAAAAAPAAAAATAALRAFLADTAARFEAAVGRARARVDGGEAGEGAAAGGGGAAEGRARALAEHAAVRDAHRSFAARFYSYMGPAADGALAAAEGSEPTPAE